MNRLEVNDKQMSEEMAECLRTSKQRPGLQVYSWSKSQVQTQPPSWVSVEFLNARPNLV